MSGPHEATAGECSPRPGRTVRIAGAALQWAVVAGMAAVFSVYATSQGGEKRALADVFTIFLSIVLEALPFMLIGSLVGGFIEVFVPRDRLSALLAGRQLPSLLLAASMGIIFPVCECAIIPVIRRLLRKGVPFSAAVGYLLGGPLVNPVVAASTFVAYGGDFRIAGARLGLGFCVAVSVGLVMGRLFRGNAAVAWDPEAGGHEHCCGDPAGHGEGGAARGFGRRILAALGHASDDFMDVGRFLVVGAFFAGILRSQISEGEVLGMLSGNPAGSITVMMGFAAALNLCSEADAFVAASFRSVIPLSGQIAFMIMGPMLDVKLLLMYLGVFRKKAIAALVVSIAAAVFGASMLAEVLL